MGVGKPVLSPCHVLPARDVIHPDLGLSEQRQSPLPSKAEEVGSGDETNP